MENLMELNRLRLDEKLRIISKNVYFQPPESLKISYPAIIYSRIRISNNLANNDIYGQRYGYKIIVIDKDPDSALVDGVSKLSPTCRHTSHYTASNFNHDVFEMIN